MKILMRLVVLAVLTFLLCSCGNGKEEASQSYDSQHDSPTLTLRDENELAMLSIMEAGKLFVSELKNAEEPANKREHQDGSALEAFGGLLNIDTLYVSGVFLDPNTPETYICMVSGFNEYNYGRSVNISFSGPLDSDEPMEWFCAMVHYYERSFFAINTYLDYLKNGDIDGLAAWLAMDGPPTEAQINSAKDTIAYYGSWCDLSELKVRENKTDLQFYGVYVSGFIYTIEDKRGNTFQVETRFGDGICHPVLHYRYY